MPAYPKMRLIAAFAVMTLALGIRAQEAMHPREESHKAEPRSVDDSKAGAEEKVQNRFAGLVEPSTIVGPTPLSAFRLGPESTFESNSKPPSLSFKTEPVPPFINFSIESLPKGVDYGITESNSSEAVRYDLSDISHQLIGQSLDHQQLAAKLSELLSGSTTRRIAIGMPDLTTNGSDGLASSLTIQLRRIDPALTLTVPAKLTADPADRQLATTPGPWVEDRTVVIERIPPTLGNEQYIATLEMHVRIAGRIRDFTLRIVHASLETVLEFLDRLGIMQRPASAYAQSSLEQLVAEARADLKRTHALMDEKSLEVTFVDQAGNIGMAELRIETTIPCS